MAAVAVSLETIRWKKDGVFEEAQNGDPVYEKKTCIMSAAAIKAHDSEMNLTVNLTLPEGERTELSSMIKELQRVTLLASKSEAVSFLDTALFGICVVKMNGHINDEQTKELIQLAIRAAAKMTDDTKEIKEKIMSQPTGE